MPSTGQTSFAGVRTLPLLAPSVIALALWIAVPLAMTVYFSLIRYNLLNPSITGFVGLENYRYLVTDPGFWVALGNTLVLVGSVLVITVIGGTLMAVLFDQDFAGRGLARLLVIAPFFVMPTVSALLWKNMLMHPVYGLFSWASRGLGLTPIDWLADYPMMAIIMIVSWQWLPFSLLILLTALQSLPAERVEAARIDGAGPLTMFRYVILPHLGRAIAVVIMIQTIFLLAIFAEIFTTTSGGPGMATTTLTYLIFLRALFEFDIGGASAGGLIAVVLANIVAIFLVRMMGRHLQAQD